MNFGRPRSTTDLDNYTSHGDYENPAATSPRVLIGVSPERRGTPPPVSIEPKTWSETVEKTIREMCESCERNRARNTAEAVRLVNYYNVLVYTVIALNPIASIIYNTLGEAQSAVVLINISLFLVSVLSGWIKYAKFEERAFVHNSFAARFSSLKSNIERQLSLAPEERVQAGDYFEWVSENYDELNNSMPLLREGKEKEEKCETKETKNEGKNMTKDPENPLTAVNVSSYSDGKMQYEMRRLFHSAK